MLTVNLGTARREIAACGAAAASDREHPGAGGVVCAPRPPYSSSDDIVFGATRACRRSVFPGAKTLASVLMNTLPVRARLSPDRTIAELIGDIRAQHVAIREFEHMPLVQVRACSGVAGDSELFESIVVFEEHDLRETLRLEGCTLWPVDIRRTVHTHYPLSLIGYTRPALTLQIDYDLCRFDRTQIERL